MPDAFATRALDCINADRPAVDVDYENGEKQFARRLKRLDADPERLDELFHYIPWPKGLTLWNFQSELEDIAAGLPGAFVVVDSLRTLLSKLSLPGEPLKVNDDGSIGMVCDPMMDVVKSKGITIGIIDRPTKQGTDADEYSTSGSGGKEFAVDAVYFWTKVEKYGEQVQGTVKIAATSDREGQLDFERYFHVGGQGEDKPLRFTPTEKGTMGDEKAGMAVLQYVMDEAMKSLTKTDIRQNVKGFRSTTVDAGLAWAIAHDEHFHVIGAETGHLSV